MITAVLIAVPATTALNPCCGKLPLHLFTACGKSNKTFIRASKQDFFFFQSEHSCDAKFLLPLLLSLHFLDPTSHPSQVHVHPVACWPCFFPFRFLDFFFFSSLWIQALQVLQEERSGDGHNSPSSLPRLERQRWRHL